uniref:Venom polypeptide n=1 Tax=Dolopus genitalis TaxID=2488630 RepID=A0A3G5BIJ2_DOLGE|nr:venom polypeptide [Dolopus genitalis]
MRLLLVLLIASIGTQSTLAEPGWWGDILSSVKDSLAKIAEKAQDLYKKAKYFPILDEAIKQLEKDLAKSGVITSLEMARKFVDTLEIQVQDLLRLVDEKLEAISIFIAKALLKEASGLNKWANKTLEKFDDPVKRAKAEKIVEKFMDKSIQKISRCARDVAKPIHDLYGMANIIAMEATKVARNAVNTLDTCSKGNDIKDCFKKLPAILEEGRNLIYAKISPMKSQLKSIASGTSISLSSCIATAKITIEINKSAVESRLKSLN